MSKSDRLILIAGPRILARLVLWIRYDLPWQMRRLRDRARRRWNRILTIALGRADVVTIEKSLPFFFYVKMPETDYLGVVTFRRYVEGRARGRKKIRVRAHVVMQPGHEIPYPADPAHAAGRMAGKFRSVMLPHADDIDDAARQVAEHVTRIRIRRAGADWRPTMTPDD